MMVLLLSFPVTAILIFILITGILLIYYFSSLGNEYSPTGKIYMMLKKKKMTFQEIIDSFPSDLISMRIKNLLEIGLIKYRNGKLHMTQKGKVIVFIFDTYGRILGWN